MSTHRDEGPEHTLLIQPGRRGRPCNAPITSKVAQAFHPAPPFSLCKLAAPFAAQSRKSPRLQIITYSGLQLYSPSEVSSSPGASQLKKLSKASLQSPASTNSRPLLPLQAGRAKQLRRYCS
jgi:hypothetical protein